MTLTIRHALALDNSLIEYLSAMTCSWSRKKLPIFLSDNGLAFWNGFFIGIPDFRYSHYSFVIDYPLDQQFSFYSALTFHESMHAKFGSHKADKKLLLNNPLIPMPFKNFSFFIANLIEDGRIERLGLVKREGSVIHHQLFRFNLLTAESNWKLFSAKKFDNDFDKFLNHLLNQLYDLVLLGNDFINEFINREEELMINEMKEQLKLVFTSYDPNSSLRATIKFFQLLNDILTKEGLSNQNLKLPVFPNHCQFNNVNQTKSSEEEIQFSNPEFNLEKLKDFLNNPFSNLFSSNESDNDQSLLNNEKDEHSAFDDSVEESNTEKEGREKRRTTFAKKPIKNISNKKKRQHRLIPKTSTIKEKLAFTQFLTLSNSNQTVSFQNLEDESFDEYIDTFGNDMVIEENETEFRYIFNDLESSINDDYGIEEFEDLYDRLELISSKTAQYFLQLAGINIKKKDEVGNQKIILTSQKDGKLQLTGNTLSQLLAGNRYIYNKEMPAKINISLDLVILVDLTGSMEFQVHCDGRTASRSEFVNEATIILANTLKILEERYNLPISYSIIGYSAPDGSTPVLEILKDFDSLNTGKQHAKAILNWYPNGENCDARAIYESVKLLENHNSSNKNKVIFFLSDGGGEGSDYKVKNLIKEEYPNFQFIGPKDFTDTIRYAFIKGIATYVFNLEQFQNSINSFDVIQAFKKYYGENISLVADLGDLIQIFTKCLLEIFRQR